MKFTIIVVALLLVVSSCSFASPGVPYLQVISNRIEDLIIELKTDDFRDFVSELTSMSHDETSKVKVVLEPEHHPDLPDLLHINVTNDDSSEKQNDFVIVLIEEYFRLRAQGFSRAFTYQSLRERYGTARCVQKNTDAWRISQKFPELPVKWLQPLKGKFPVGTLPWEGPAKRQFAIEDRDISVIVVISETSEEHAISRCIVDTQALRPNLRFAFDAAVGVMSAYGKKTGRIPIKYYWKELKTMLSHDYGIDWKTPAEIQPGDYD
jgi:hypothetical protein